MKLHLFFLAFANQEKKKKKWRFVYLIKKLKKIVFVDLVVHYFLKFKH